MSDLIPAAFAVLNDNDVQHTTLNTYEYNPGTLNLEFVVDQVVLGWDVTREGVPPLPVTATPRPVFPTGTVAFHVVRIVEYPGGMAEVLGPHGGLWLSGRAESLREAEETVTDGFHDGVVEEQVRAGTPAPKGPPVTLRDENISGRACAPLEKNLGVVTVADLGKHPRADVKDTRGVSRDTFKALEALMRRDGVSFADEPDADPAPAPAKRSTAVSSIL